MGSGQSCDSAYGSRRGTARVAPDSWAQSVKTNNMRSYPNSEPILDKKTLEEYLQIEREIAEAQRSDPDVLPQFKNKMTQLEEVNQRLEQLDEQLNRAPNTAASNERDQARKHQSELTGELNQLRYKVDNLEELHMRQDELLDNVPKPIAWTLGDALDIFLNDGEGPGAVVAGSTVFIDGVEPRAKIFGGGYGSRRESELEQELDMLEAQRARIMEANFKWRQAQMMMEYACRQLAVAVQKWQDLPDIPTIELEIRYTMPASARKSLLAANPGAIDMTRADGVDPADINREIERVFEAPQSDDPEEAKKQLQQNHDKASSLLRWFEQVLNTTIMQDLNAINRRVRLTTQALKEERIRLIKQKVHEIWGDDVEIEIEEDKTPDEQHIAVDLNSITDVSDKDLEQLNDEYMGLDDIDIGQMPTSEEIFGKSYEEFKQELDNMREKHETDMSVFLREQDRQAARTRGDLQAKLEARRKQRALRSLENKQRHALATGTTVS
ncbi:hypothetical protein FJT64_016111 [Amphibalanus amphitrite]|uniref:Uncharacterized protein n=1 Tax=Amphibalanus amphitrite TaxID=1232801 RepID=A0A6A4X7C9_AMPAM|nr:hypothetical protein FJT64_016111 [Amphibalanus amphitrite]